MASSGAHFGTRPEEVKPPDSWWRCGWVSLSVRFSGLNPVSWSQTLLTFAHLKTLACCSLGLSTLTSLCLSLSLTTHTHTYMYTALLSWAVMNTEPLFWCVCLKNEPITPETCSCCRYLHLAHSLSSPSSSFPNPSSLSRVRWGPLVQMEFLDLLWVADCIYVSKCCLCALLILDVDIHNMNPVFSLDWILKEDFFYISSQFTALCVCGLSSPPHSES